MYVKKHGHRQVATFCAVALVLGLMLSACSKKEDRKETPATSQIIPTVTVAATTANGRATTKPGSGDGANASASAITDANGQQITDGVCQVFIPDGWVDDGTGRGSTTSGANFVLFGGSIASDADWQAASTIVATPIAGRTIASIERTATTIRVLYASDKGFEYRARFGNRYCDFRVYRIAGAIPANEKALWQPLLDTLGPVS